MKEGEFAASRSFNESDVTIGNFGLMRIVVLQYREKFQSMEKIVGEKHYESSSP
jgi:hypothetical protein